MSVRKNKQEKSCQRRSQSSEHAPRDERPSPTQRDKPYQSARRDPAERDNRNRNRKRDRVASRRSTGMSNIMRRIKMQHLARSRHVNSRAKTGLPKRRATPKGQRAKGVSGCVGS